MGKKNKKNRRKNPAGPGAVILGIAAVGGLAYAGYMSTQKKTKKKKKAEGVPVGRLSGIYAENATLGNSPEVLNRIALPLNLGQFGAVQLRYRDKTDTYNTMSIGRSMVRGNNNKIDISWKDALKRLVTNMTQKATEKAWPILVAEAAAGNDLSSVNPQLDAAIIKTLSEIAPGTDWSKGLSEYDLMSPEAYVWQGLALLAAIAHQTKKNSAKPPVPEGGPSDEEVPDGGPADEEVPDNIIDPAEQVVVDDLKKKLNGLTNYYLQGGIGTTIKAPEIVALIEDTNGFSAILAIYADAMTQSNGQYLGVAFYTSSFGKEGGNSLRSQSAASVPDKDQRISELETSLLHWLSVMQENI